MAPVAALRQTWHKQFRLNVWPQEYIDGTFIHIFCYSLLCNLSTTTLPTAYSSHNYRISLPHKTLQLIGRTLSFPKFFF